MKICVLDTTRFIFRNKSSEKFSSFKLYYIEEIIKIPTGKNTKSNSVYIFIL